jgi:hypothetical protein
MLPGNVCSLEVAVLAVRGRQGGRVLDHRYWLGILPKATVDFGVHNAHVHDA